VRMRSEFSLKRCFQSWCEFNLPFSRKPSTLTASLERNYGSQPDGFRIRLRHHHSQPHWKTMRIMKVALSTSVSKLHN